MFARIAELVTARILRSCLETMVEFAAVVAVAGSTVVDFEMPVLCLAAAAAAAVFETVADSYNCNSAVVLVAVEQSSAAGIVLVALAIKMDCTKSKALAAQRGFHRYFVEPENAAAGEAQ